VLYVCLSQLVQSWIFSGPSCLVSQGCVLCCIIVLVCCMCVCLLQCWLSSGLGCLRSAIKVVFCAACNVLVCCVFVLCRVVFLAVLVACVSQGCVLCCINVLVCCMCVCLVQSWLFGGPSCLRYSRLCSVLYYCIGVLYVCLSCAELAFRQS
jgi:hypothetical protein